MITSVALSPAVDVTYVVADLVEGQTHRPESVHRHAGGKAINMARAAARLGARVRVVAPVPAEAAHTFRAELEADGIELTTVETSAPMRMCVSIASRSTGRMTEVYEHPPALAVDEADAVSAVLQATLNEVSGWVSVSGSAPGEHGIEVIRGLVARVQGNAVLRVAVDSHGPMLDVAVASRPAVVKVNRHEAVALTGRPASSPLADLVGAVHARAGGLVVVTDSVNGAMARTATTQCHLRLPDVLGVFSQGSGDSMLGGMLAAYEAGADDLDALRLGVGAATANALVPGAGHFDATLARSLAARVEVTHS